MTDTLFVSKNPMAKKRRFERVQCGMVKCSLPVAPEPQIKGPMLSILNSSFTIGAGACDHALCRDA